VVLAVGDLSVHAAPQGAGGFEATTIGGGIVRKI